MALLKEVKRESLRREWRAISMLLAQIAVVILILFQLVKVIGLNVNFHLGQIVLKPSTDPSNLAVLALAVIVFALLFFAVKKRQPRLFEAQRKAPGIIVEEARKKLRKAREEPQAPALLLIEFMFVVVVVFSMQAYLDPDLELIPWSEVGIGPPVTTVVNAAIAVIVLAAFYYLYKFTEPYRKGFVPKGLAMPGNSSKASKKRK